MKPHRAGTVLFWGIVSLCCNLCFIPGVLAWAYGSTDLAEMDGGTMDPSGRQTTNVGRILGIIGTILAVAEATGLGVHFHH